MLYNTTINNMKLITFDWDQTLWDSWRVHVSAVQHAARTIGLPPPIEAAIASAYYSAPFDQHMELIFAEATQRAMPHYMDFYDQNVPSLAGLFDGVTETLVTLAARGYLLAILSDKREPYGSAELATSGVSHLFECTLFLDDTRPNKPDPEGLRQVMDQLDVDPTDVLYIGDSQVDIQCARRAGTSGAAALWGSINHVGLLKEAPDYAFSSITELLAELPPR